MDLLKGKVAIVSGIGPGVGKEVAYAFAREGADVVLAARTASALEEVALGIQKRRQKSLCVPTDISSADAVRAASTTSAPSRANAIAAARPMPLSAPVIRVRFPVSRPQPR